MIHTYRLFVFIYSMLLSMAYGITLATCEPEWLCVPAILGHKPPARDIYQCTCTYYYKFAFLKLYENEYVG